MKWDNLEFLSITEEEEYYKYIYAVLAKTTFKKKYLKLEFRSAVPHYRWTDIQETMVKADMFVEDIVIGEFLDLGIGHITYTIFTPTEFENYSADVANWKLYREEALVSQGKLCDEYREVWGEPDLPDTVKWR